VGVLKGMLYFLIGQAFITSHNFKNEDLKLESYFAGIPFIISSGILTYKIIKARMQNGRD